MYSNSALCACCKHRARLARGHAWSDPAQRYTKQALHPGAHASCTNLAVPFMCNLPSRLSFQADLPSTPYVCPRAAGLVGEARFAVLPPVPPAATAALVLLAMAPCLLLVWRRPEPARFARAAAYANLCGFMFGYHVHEKAVLTVRTWRTCRAGEASA